MNVLIISLQILLIAKIVKNRMHILKIIINNNNWRSLYCFIYVVFIVSNSAIIKMFVGYLRHDCIIYSN
jgi:hypothetical protein